MRCYKIALCAAVFVIPFAAYGINILHSFYDIGSSFYDAGWTAYLIHDGDLQLHNPPCVGQGLSWFHFHTSPLFLVTSALGRLLPLTRIEFYAAFIGVSHALPAVAVFWLLVSGYRMTRPVAYVAAVLLAFFFSFNGLALAIARFPHFAMFMVGTGMMFLVALVLRRVGVALFFFILCLSTREDAGLHLFAMLSLLSVLERARGTPWLEQTPTLAFAAAALLYSVAAVAIQQAFSSDYSLLTSEYLGRPIFAGVSASSMAARLLGWVVYRTYVVFPALCALTWAIVRRNPYVVLGYASFLPWGVLHLVAAREMVGLLPSYYAFPYMFAAFWPLIGIFVQRQHGDEGRSILEPVCGFAFLIAASFTTSQYLHNPTHIDLPAGFLSPPSLSRQAATDQAVEGLAASKELGRILIDQSVFALSPELYRTEDVLSSEEPHEEPDSIVYFAGGFENVLAREKAAQAGLTHIYGVRRTQLRIATNRPIEDITGLVRFSPIE